MWTIVPRFFVQVPIHRAVMLEYFQRDTGTFGTKMEIDWDHPIITDLSSGVRFGTDPIWDQQMPGSLKPEVHLAERRFATVRACDVYSQGGEDPYLKTRLALEPLDRPPPDAVYPLA